MQRRIRLKFGDAQPPLYFTRTLLQQASTSELADYKTRRLIGPATPRVWDLCCGAGGDLFSLAKGRPCAIGVDQDAVACELARANLKALNLNAEVRHGDALRCEVDAADVLHVDPDRRSQGRTISAEHFSPPLSQLEPLLHRAARAAVKLAPATELNPQWSAMVEREWLGQQRETKQQVAWFGQGDVAAGKRRATVIRDGRIDSLLESDAAAEVALGSLCDYLWEPHSAVRAARLTDELAVQRGARRLSFDSPYLTSTLPSPDGLAATLHVIEEMGWNLRRCQRRLRQWRPSLVEVKSRGLGIEPNELARRLGGGDGPPLVLLIHRTGKQLRAIFAKRPQQ